MIGNYEVGYKLYRNQVGTASANGRVAFTLKGGGAVNRDAVGARVTLTTADGHRQVQEVQIGSSLGAGNSSTLYFGLGAQTIQSLEIRWPDGTTQTYTDVPVNMHYTIPYDGQTVTTAGDTQSPAISGPSSSIARTVLTIVLTLFLLTLGVMLVRRMKKA